MAGYLIISFSFEPIHQRKTKLDAFKDHVTSPSLNRQRGHDEHQTQRGKMPHEHKQKSNAEIGSLNRHHNRNAKHTRMHNPLIIQRKQTYIPELIMFIIIHLSST